MQEKKRLALGDITNIFQSRSADSSNLKCNTRQSQSHELTIDKPAVATVVEVKPFKIPSGSTWRSTLKPGSHLGVYDESVGWCKGQVTKLLEGCILLQYQHRNSPIVQMWVFDDSELIQPIREVLKHYLHPPVKHNASAIVIKNTTNKNIQTSLHTQFTKVASTCFFETKRKQCAVAVEKTVLHNSAAVLSSRTGKCQSLKLAYSPQLMTINATLADDLLPILVPHSGHSVISRRKIKRMLSVDYLCTFCLFAVIIAGIGIDKLFVREAALKIIFNIEPNVDYLTASATAMHEKAHLDMGMVVYDQNVSLSYGRLATEDRVVDTCIVEISQELVSNESTLWSKSSLAELGYYVF